MPVLLEGFTEAQRAFALAEKNVRLGVPKELRQVAEPVRATVERRAVSEISGVAKRAGVPKAPQWQEMRTGVTRKLVYVAPRQRGVKGRGDLPARRSKFATKMMGEAMEPALTQHGPQIERDVERFIDTVADRFNRGV